ncbi:uncharacterized protein LOC141511704 [Macrotis lagotis]|uniref:uncharacterized protein LOC141511704 n=1 Tax=Macrotis lagotis TaxID=92651 RepID=UPI003D691250
MPISTAPLPFISSSVINVRKLDPRNINMSTVIDYITKKNKARNMNNLQFPKEPTCFPKNFPLEERLLQNKINEKRNTLASTSKNTEELNSKMKKRTLPKLQPSISVPKPIKNEQNAKKNKEKVEKAKILLEEFRQNVKAIRKLMNPEGSSKVEESEKKAAESKKEASCKEVHLFPPFAEVNCKREENIELVVTGSRYKSTNLTHMRSKFIVDQYQRLHF